MSRKADFARLEGIVGYVDDIFAIVGRHGSITNTLNDMEGQYAVMLCLTQIGELLGKVQEPELASQLPVRMAGGLRNIIVHDYEGVEMTIIGNTIRESLPELRLTVQALLDAENLPGGSHVPN